MTRYLMFQFEETEVLRIEESRFEEIEVLRFDDNSPHLFEPNEQINDLVQFFLK